MTNSNYKRKTLQTMKENGFTPVLLDTLEGLDATRNKLAVESRIRPITINEIASGEAKTVSFDTMAAILNALDVLSEGKTRHSVSDVFVRAEA